MPDYPLFSVLGIEIEYMIVRKETLEVVSISDEILKTFAGHLVNEFSFGHIAMSNELVMHVLELKTDGPKSPDTDISQLFHQTIMTLDKYLCSRGLMLLPTGAHPFMNPATDTNRWPHDNQAIYRQYDTIFNCQGHGFSNLQSMHVNLPFISDEDFFHLHSAIRLILPLIPALAASTPILQGKLTGMLDSRLYYYERNQQAIPSITGHVIPEFIKTPKQYQNTILTPMYRDIAAFDKEGLLQEEWLNSRAAIAKFDKKAIEIRIIDSQECPDMDIAIAKFLRAILQSLHETSDYHLKNPIETSLLKQVYDDCLTTGLSTIIDDKMLLKQWQLPNRRFSVQDILSLWMERISPLLDSTTQNALALILSKGNLATRIVNATKTTSIMDVYQTLGQCLVTNQPFKSIS